jgi:iron complex transport system substrate-binding protein
MVLSVRGKASVLILTAVLLASLGSSQETVLKDDAGNVFPPAAPPQRIVSLAPNITEILFALGLGDRVVGVTRYCDYPAAALQKEKVGGLIDPGIEKIRSLKPDLIIAFRGNPWSVIARLQTLGMRVFVLDIGNGLDSVPKTIAKIGRITQKEDEAAALVRRLEDRYRKTLDSLSGVAGKPRVFVSLHAIGLATCGRPSYFNDMIERAKAVNVAGRVSKQWLDYSREQFIRDDPEIIVILAKSEEDFEKARDWFKAQAGFDSVTAVRTSRIRFLDENIASRFGPRLYDAFAELARLIHPELFEKTP